MTKKILVLGPAWVGDMMMAQVLFKLLVQQQADVHIDVVAPPHSGPMVTRMPEIQRFIPLAIKHGEFNGRARLQMAKQLRQTHYDQAIVCPNSWKSALIPLLARIPVRTGWRGEWRYGLLTDLRILDKKTMPLMIQRYAALAFENKAILPRELPWPALSIDADSVARSLQSVSLAPPTQPVLALCPGAEFGEAKRWPAKYYAQVAKQKLDQGYAVWLFGSPKEQADAAEIMQLTDQRCVDLTGKTQLTQAIDLMSLSHCVVSNDSGLMHIAAALGKPLVAIYGSSSPFFTPPLGDKVKIVRLGLPCSPCFQRVCPLGHLKCLNDLKPEMVLDALLGVE